MELAVVLNHWFGRLPFINFCSMGCFKRFYLLVLVILVSSSLLWTQLPCTFNVRTVTDKPTTVLNAVIADAQQEFKAIGLVVDKISPFYSGTIIYGFDSIGRYEVEKEVYYEGVDLETWGRESFLFGDDIYLTGYVLTYPGREILLGKYDLVEEEYVYNTLPHPSYPEEDFNNAIGLKKLNDEFFLYGNFQSVDSTYKSEGSIYTFNEELEAELVLAIKDNPRYSVIVWDVEVDGNGNKLVLFSEYEWQERCEAERWLTIRLYDHDFSNVLQEYSFRNRQLLLSDNSSLRVGTDGAIYLHTQTITYGNTNPNCNVGFSRDPRVYKFNASLGLEWEADFTREEDFPWEGSVADIVATEDGNFVTAYSQNVAGDTAELTFQTLVNVIKFTSEGELLWRQQYAGFPDDNYFRTKNNIYDLKGTPDGGFVMVGESRREPTNFAIDTTGEFRQRGWILKVDADGRLHPSCLDSTVSSVNYENIEGKSGLLFPNPTDGLLNIQPKGRWGQHLLFTITDNLGRVVRRQKAYLPASGETTFTIGVHDLRAGVYHLLVEDGQSRWVDKFIRR